MTADKIVFISDKELKEQTSDASCPTLAGIVPANRIPADTMCSANTQGSSGKGGVAWDPALYFSYVALGSALLASRRNSFLVSRLLLAFLTLSPSAARATAPASRRSALS